MDATLRSWEADRLAGTVAAGQEPRPPAAEPAGTEPALDATYRVGEASVRLRCFDPALARTLAALAGPARCDGPGREVLSVVPDGGRLLLLLDGEPAGDFATRAAAKWGVLKALVAPPGRPGARRSGSVVLHAGAAADPETGAAVVLAGASGSGKTTLTAALVASGLRLLSDDLVPLDGGVPGRTRVVPIAMSVKAGSWPVLEPLFPELAGLPVVHGRLTGRYLWPADRVAEPGGAYRVALLLFPEYAKDAVPRPERLDPLEALRRLTATGSGLPEAEADLRGFVAWLWGVPAYRLAFGDLAAAVAEARSLLGGAGS